MLLQEEPLLVETCHWYWVSDMLPTTPTENCAYPPALTVTFWGCCVICPCAINGINMQMRIKAFFASICPNVRIFTCVVAYAAFIAAFIPKTGRDGFAMTAVRDEPFGFAPVVWTPDGIIVPFASLFWF